MRRPDDIAARLELLERALASLAPAALGSACKPAGLPTGGSLLDAKGIRQRSKSYGVDTFVRGHRVTRGGFASRAAAERCLYELRADKTALEAFLVGRYAAPTVRAVIEAYMAGRGGTCKSADRHRQMQVHLLAELDDEAASKITEHIHKCPKHPMRTPERHAANWRLRWEELLKYIRASGMHTEVKAKMDQLMTHVEYDGP